MRTIIKRESWLRTSAVSYTHLYINTDNFLKDRLCRSIAIQGTQKLHGFIPIPSSISKVKVKAFSESDISTTEKVTTIQDRLQLIEVSGYITIIYENNWWLAYVLAKEESIDEVKVSFLHPAGPSTPFTYPRKADILWLSVTHVLCKVNPVMPVSYTHLS